MHIIKLIFSIALLLSFSFLTYPQSSNTSSWITPGISYAKIKVIEKGIYRISQNQLLEAGIALDASKISIHYLGNEIPFYSTSDVSISSNDYIEFYGDPNNGSFDSQLYADSADQLHPESSLFSDTATYFISSNDEASSIRFEDVSTTISGLLPSEDFFWFESFVSLKEIHSAGNPVRVSGENMYYSAFEQGEGFTSDTIHEGTTRIIEIPTPNIYDTSEQGNLQIRLQGFSNDFTVINDHSATFQLGSIPYGSVSFEAFDTKNFSAFIPNSFLDSPSTQISINNSSASSSLDKIALVSASIKYARSFQLGSLSQLSFHINHQNETVLNISEVEAANQLVLYDLTNKNRYLINGTDGEFPVLLTEGAAEGERRFCLIDNESGFLVPELTNAVEYKDWTLLSNQGNFISIFHPNLTEDAVENYSTYRESDAGGNYIVSNVDVTQLFDQFAYGIHNHPLAIQYFIDDAIENWSIPPDYLLLLGKGISYNHFINEAAFANCLVPTYGHSPSDQLLSSQSDTDSFTPRLATARVPATNASELTAFLQKVISTESQQNDPCLNANSSWMKTAQYLYQGPTEGIANSFAAQLESYALQFSGAPYYGYTNPILGSLTDPTPQPELTSNIENGIGLMHYLGNTSDFDFYWNFDIQQPNFYNWNSHYPTIISNAALTGNTFFDSSFSSMAEDFILADEQGAIAFLGLVDIGFPNPLNEFNLAFYNNFTASSYGSSIAKCIQNSCSAIASDNPDDAAYPGTRLTCEQMSFSGDPAFSFFSPTQLDFALTAESLSLTYYPSPIETINLSFENFNNGLQLIDSVEVQIEQIFPNGETVVLSSFYISSSQLSQLTEIEDLSAFHQTGTNTFVVSLNPNEDLDESCFSNNSLSIEIDIECTDSPAAFNLNSYYCQNEGILQLEASPNGGSFSSSQLEISDTGTIDLTNSIPGSYSIDYSFTDVSGCQWSSSNSLVITASPSITFEPFYVLTVGESITLNAGNLGSSYLWSTGETTMSITLSELGDYSVTITNESGCQTIANTSIGNNCDFISAEILMNNNYCLSTHAVELIAEPNTGYFESPDGALFLEDGFLIPANSQAGEHELLFYLEDENNCEFIDTLIINIFANPILSLEPEYNLPAGEELELDVTIDGATYLWSTAETSPQISINELGDYSVIVSLNGCSTAASFTVSQISGISSNSVLEEITISPNPTSGKSIIKSNSTSSIYLQLASAEGKILMQKRKVNLPFELDLSKYPSGIYLLDLINPLNSESSNFKIIKY